MARKNIFDIMSERFDLDQELQRLQRLFEDECIIYVLSTKKRYSVLEYVKRFSFDDWSNRGRCIDAEDFLEVIEYDRLWYTARDNVLDFLQLLEILYNFYCMVRVASDDFGIWVNRGDEKKFDLLRKIIDDCLAHFNYKGEYFPELEQLIVVEDKPEITAVAEIVEKELAVEIIRYNHYALKGDLQNKKAILLRLASDLEPKRPDIKNINGPLEDGIFYILNNLNLRHNNTIAGDRYYRQAVVDMDELTLEEWYDELYQMMLLAYLQLDNVERNRKVKDLKKLITP